MNIPFWRKICLDKPGRWTQCRTKSGGVITRFILTYFFVKRIPVQTILTDNYGPFIPGTNAIGLHTFIFWKEAISGNATEGRIFGFCGIIGPGIWKQGITAPIGFFSEYIDITWRLISYFHFET